MFFIPYKKGFMCIKLERKKSFEEGEMVRKKVLIVLFFLSFVILGGCADKQVSVKVPDGKSDFIPTTDYGNYATNEKQLNSFVENKMLTKQGIYTNYKKQSYRKNEARGHELLSESSGMWLEYLAFTHQYPKFRKFYKATKQTFDQGTQFSYRYNPATKKKSKVNATLDDLRIIRALQIYADQTGSNFYKQEAAKRFAMLKEKTMSNGKIASFYDTGSKQSSADGALSYYDFSTLKYFESTSKSSRKMYQKQLEVVQNGYLGDAFPLYANSYDWQNKAYSTGNINASEVLEIIFHLSQIGKAKEVSISWLKHQVDNNTLYNTYSTNGSVVEKGHSAGSYAIAAMIFASQKDPEMYHKAMKLVWKYQVTNEQSPIDGGIGIAEQNEAYSFNNLTTLLATRY